MMLIRTIVIFLALSTMSIPSVSRAQSPAVDPYTTLRLDSLIRCFDRFDNKPDSALRCFEALEAFRKEYKSNPASAFAALYFARAFDHLAGISNECGYQDSLFLRFADSAHTVFLAAERLQPGIQEKRFGFTVPVLIGHLYGSRCLWYLRKGKVDEAKRELQKAKSEGAFTPSQLEMCKLLLDYCDSNAIFISAGDDDTFPTMYLQMVEGYRPDVTVANSSILSMSWYAKMLTSKPLPGIKPFSVNLSPAEMDGLDSAIFAKYPPEKLLADVDPEANARFATEIGMETRGPVELCFPVYEPYPNGYYCVGSQRVIASMLQVNKWKRPVYFGTGSRDSYSKCSRVAFRSAGLIDELIPIAEEQVDKFKKRGIWFNESRMQKLLMDDARMPAFINDTVRSYGQILMFTALVQYLSLLDSGSSLIHLVYEKIRHIPRRFLSGYESTIIGLCQILREVGMKEAAKQECIPIMPVLKEAVGSMASSVDQNSKNYFLALLFTGQCKSAIDFLNALDMTTEERTQTIQEMGAAFDCR